MVLPKPGDMVEGRYLVGELLGEGGFGAVFAATDVGAPRPVAMKFVKPDDGDRYLPRSRARFNREIQMVARLRNPHTVKLFDYGETAGGVLYMVFEFIGGEDLAELLEREGRFAPAAAVHVLRQLLGSLGEAHAAGLLHRDVKPQNVRVFEFMGDPLNVKLLDFGLARATDGGHPSVTATGEFVGTPRYMAPEQLLSEELTAATDLYCLGLLAYELVVGPGALTANTVGQQLERLQSGHVLSVPELERMGPKLASVLARMTARKPADRFQSAAAVANALAGPELPAVLSPSSDGQVAAPLLPPPRPPATTERRARSQPLGVIAVIAVIAALGALGVVAWMIFDDPPPRPIPAVVQRPAPRPAVTQPTAKPEDAGASAPTTRAADVCERALVGRKYLVDHSFAMRWLTYVPPSLDPSEPAPLVILFHQEGHTPEVFLDTAGFRAVADKEGFVLIAPDGGGIDAWNPAMDYLEGVQRLRETALERLCVDESRIFLVGHGSGGDMADHVMCLGWAAGFATHALPRERGDKFCEPTRPTPNFIFYPTKSGYEPLNGGISASDKNRESMAEIEARWIARNDCKTRPIVTHEGQSECFEWDCGTALRSCRVEGGHGWPGTPRRSRLFSIRDGDGPEPDASFPMARLTWDFFKSLDREPQ